MRVQVTEGHPAHASLGPAVHPQELLAGHPTRVSVVDQGDRLSDLVRNRELTDREDEPTRPRPGRRFDRHNRVRGRVVLLEEEPVDVHLTQAFADLRLRLHQDRSDSVARGPGRLVDDRELLESDRGAGLRAWCYLVRQGSPRTVVL